LPPWSKLVYYSTLARLLYEDWEMNTRDLVDIIVSDEVAAILSQLADFNAQLDEITQALNNIDENKDSKILSIQAPNFLIKYSHLLKKQYAIKDNPPLIIKMINQFFSIYAEYTKFLISNRSLADVRKLDRNMASVTTFEHIPDLKVRFNCCMLPIFIGNHSSDLNHLEFAAGELNNLKKSCQVDELILKIDNALFEITLSYIAIMMGYEPSHEIAAWKKHLETIQKNPIDMNNLFEYIIAQYLILPFRTLQYEIMIESCKAINEAINKLGCNFLDAKILAKIAMNNELASKFLGTEKSAETKLKRLDNRYRIAIADDIDNDTSLSKINEYIKQLSGFIRYQIPNSEEFRPKLAAIQRTLYDEISFKSLLFLQQAYTSLEKFQKKKLTIKKREIMQKVLACKVENSEHRFNLAKGILNIAHQEYEQADEFEDLQYTQKYYAAAAEKFSLVTIDHPEFIKLLCVKLINCLLGYIKCACDYQEKDTGLGITNKKIYLRQHKPIFKKIFGDRSSITEEQAKDYSAHLNFLYSLIKKSVLDTNSINIMRNIINSLLHTGSNARKIKKDLLEKIDSLSEQLEMINKFISEFNTTKDHDKNDRNTANAHLVICIKENLNDLMKTELSIILMKLDEKNFNRHYQEAVNALMEIANKPTDLINTAIQALEKDLKKFRNDQISLDELEKNDFSIGKYIREFILDEQYEVADCLSNLILAMSQHYKKPNDDSLDLEIKKRTHTTILSALYYLIFDNENLSLENKIHYCQLYLQKCDFITIDISNVSLPAKDSAKVCMYLYENTGDPSYIAKKQYIDKALTFDQDKLILEEKISFETTHLLEMTQDLDVRAKKLLLDIETSNQFILDSESYQSFPLLDFNNKYKHTSIPDMIIRLHQSLKDEYEAIAKHIINVNRLKDQLLAQLSSHTLPYTPIALDQLDEVKILARHVTQVEQDALAYEALTQHIACIETALALLKTDFDAFKKHAAHLNDCETRFLSDNASSHTISMQSNSDEKKSQPARDQTGNKKAAANAQAQTHQSARQRKVEMRAMREAELASQKAAKEKQDQQRKADFEIKRQEQQKVKEIAEQEAKRKAEREAERLAEQKKLEKMLKQKEREVKIRNNILLNGKGAKISFANLAQAYQIQKRIEDRGSKCLWVGSFAHRVIIYHFTNKPWLAKHIVVNDLDFRIFYHDKFDQKQFRETEGFNLEVIENDQVVSAKRDVPGCIPMDTVIEKIEDCPRNYVSAFDHCGLILHANIDKMTDRKERDIVPIGDYFAEICIPPSYRQTIINTCQSKELLLYPMNVTHRYYVAIVSKLRINLSHALPELDLAANVSQLEGMLPYLQAVYQTEEYLYQQFVANRQMDNPSVCYDEIINLIRRNIAANDADHLKPILQRFFSAWIRHNFTSITDLSIILEFTNKCSEHFIRLFIMDEQAKNYSYSLVVRMINDHAEEYIRSKRAETPTTTTSTLGIFAHNKLGVAMTNAPVDEPTCQEAIQPQ